MNNYLNICFTVPSERYIIVVFRDDTQQFERCVQILESLKNAIKVQEINRLETKYYTDYSDGFNFD